MRKFKFLPAWVLMLMLVLSSCSKDEPEAAPGEEDVATLSFGATINDLMKKQDQKQQQQDLPECSDATPASVAYILSLDGEYVVGDVGNPATVSLNPEPFDSDNDGVEEYFTNESADLELPPGEYVLEWFQVLDADGNVIWTAPIDTGMPGDFDGLVDNALPMTIKLGAGVKKYVPVDVLCFDDRFVNQYGYLFFEMEETQAIEFCVFGNVCDETGRHFPANFRFDVWTYSGDPENPQGVALFDENDPFVNVVGVNEDGDAYAEPVCMYLPDTPGEDIYYGELYLIEDGTRRLIRQGQFTDADVRSLFVGEGENDYFHFREGDCAMDDTPDLFEEGETGGGGELPGTCDPEDPAADCDNDGVLNADDQCPSTPAGVDVNDVGCDDVLLPGQDLVVFNDWNLFDAEAMQDPDNVQLVQNLVTFTTPGSRNDGDVVVIDRGRNSPCSGGCGDWSKFISTMEDEGFTVEEITSTPGSLTDIDPDVKVMILVLPAVSYTVEEINALKRFAAEGGRIIFIGEHEGFYGSIDVQNEFLSNMGAVLQNTGGSVDCGYTEIPSTSNSEHPIMAGVESVMMACASVIEPGPNDFVLWYDTSGSYPLAGVARIDTTPVRQMMRKKSTTRLTGPQENIPNPDSPTGF